MVRAGVITVIAFSVVAVAMLAIFFPILFPPNNLMVDDDSTINSLYAQYDKAIRALLGQDFDTLTIPEKDQLMEDVKDLNEELEKDIMDNNLNQTDPIDIEDDNSLVEECVGECLDALEVVNPCIEGFIFTDNLGCLPETLEELAKILDFDPLDPATQFKVISIIDLVDSNGQKFENVVETDLPLSSLLTREGNILDLARLDLRLIGESDSRNPIQAEGLLDIVLNGNSQRQFNLKQVATPNQITSAFEIKIGGKSLESFSFAGLQDLQSGDFANNLQVNLRDFSIIQGNSTFFSPQDIPLYELDFDFDAGLRTVTGSTGIIGVVPIADGTIELCADARQTLVNGVQVDVQPDVPRSVTVQVPLLNANGVQIQTEGVPQFSNIVTPFTVDINLQSIGTTRINLPTFCEKSDAVIPRSSDVQVVVTGIKCGTGTTPTCQDLPATVFKITTPETSGVQWKIECFIGGIEVINHWCNSNFGYSYNRG